MSFCVKLDSDGRVVGFQNGPAYPGWMDVTGTDVAREPMSYRRDSVSGWIRMETDETIQRDIDHADAATAPHPAAPQVRQGLLHAQMLTQKMTKDKKADPDTMAVLAGLQSAVNALAVIVLGDDDGEAS